MMGLEKLRNSRKGTILLYPIVGALIIAIGTFYIMKAGGGGQIPPGFAGKRALSVIDTSIDVENLLFEIELSAG